jgi:hypothetical protein
MAGIKDYSTTQANNTSLNGISTAEGMLPSNLNNAIRALMKNTREWFNDSQWVEYGDGSGAYVSTYVSGTSFRIDGVDVTSIYHEGRSVTTVKIAADAVNGSKIADDSIDSEHYVDGSIDTQHIADSQITNAKMADDSIDSAQYIDGSIDTAHIANSQITNAKMAVNSIDSDQYVDGSIDTAHIADSQVTTAKIANNAITTGKILDGTILNADINASAAIDATKIADGSVTSTEFQYINTLSSNAQTQISGKLTASNNLSDVTSASTSRTNLGLGTISTQDASNVAVTGGSVTGLGEPSANSDAATKSYVDQAVAGLRTRAIAEAATTGNIDLTADLQNGDTIDGVTLVTGDRVLVKDQTDATANGLYIAVASGTASRDPEYDTIAELSGSMVVVNQGSTNDNKIFLCTTDSDATIGVSNITYTVITPSNVGTVTSVGVADSGSSEFTVANSPITSSGTITLEVNSIANTKITGLGTSSTLNVGTSANNVVQLNGSAQLPAVDGSNLTNLPDNSIPFAIALG